MKVCVLLLCVCCLCWRTEAQSRTYLITAPLTLHVDAVETVVLQLFGYSGEVRVHVFLRPSMSQPHLVEEAVTLNSQNNYQAAVKVQLFRGQLKENMKHVILHVQSAEFNQNVPIAVSRSNGFLFIQTDKPLYTPQQKVKVRAFSLNQELRPANRSVFLTFRDPDHKIVDIVEMIDVNNGIPSMQNPFKIPIRPKLGIWFIEAAYSNDFTTTAKADFEVREYVLPSFSILVEPQTNFISYGNFKHFNFKVSARYLHGAPVADGEVFLRYGYVTKTDTIIIPKSITTERLSKRGEVDVTVNMEEVLSKHSEPKDLNSVVGNYLYITVLLQESTGGISQEAEFTAVKFVKSPYRLSLVSTAPFIKPGLPFNIQVLVKDHLDKPVDRIRVRLVEQQLWGQRDVLEGLPCPDSSISQSDGLAVFICNTPREAIKTVLKFETADTALPAASQASLTLEAKAYHSPNQRYLYIDPPMPSQGLRVGQYANINVFSATPSYIPVQSLSFLVLSKGKVVDFGTVRFPSRAGSKTTVSFLVTSAMAPSIRLLVYYILYGEGTSELVADSVWLDVRDKCVSGLQTELSYQRRDYKPKQNLQLDIRTNHEGLVALSAVDSGLYTLRPNYRDPVTMVLRHIEQSDQGCGGGGGKDSADVFRLAGLTFLTNANAHPSASNEPCTALVRPKRALSKEEKTKKAESFGQLKTCCEWGMRHIPKSVTCTQFSKQLKKVLQPCRDAFKECCEFIQQDLDRDPHLILGRHDLGADFDLAPSLVRTSFPESWLWEVQRASRGLQSVTRTLPDSLTTWEIKAIGMFKTGMCVSDPIQVPVNLPLSVDVPLPYQVVRGEQLELSGSVYNQQTSKVKYCVTLTAGPAFCLLKSTPVAGEEGLHSTTCEWSTLFAGEVGKVTFTLLGLDPGEHTLTFTLKTPEGNRDIVTKTLRVEPEGVKQEDYSGGRLDPQGLYGSQKREVKLKNEPPPNIVPNTAVERLLTINGKTWKGEVLGEVMSVMHNPDGLRQLINLPEGSAEAESGTLIPLVQVFLYLESTGSWDVLGDDIQKNARDMKQKIKEGVISITSFRGGDSSYSMWMKREPSTWVTALMVKTLSAVDQVFSVDHQELSLSVTWLIRHTQQPDGSFRETSDYKPKMMAEGTDEVERSVYLTSFVLIALKKATSIRDPILQLQFQDNSMMSAVAYISQHAPTVKSVYVRAIATYALTLHDPNDATASHLFNGLERLAQQKGNPVVRRFWKEPSETADWLKPDQSSGRTVEMTAYILLTVLLKGRIPYANPILSWLTQDQHYGEGFYSVQDTVLTLEAVTEYSRVIPRAVLSQHINIRYSRKGALAKVQLNQTRTVATPIEVKKDDDIIVSTGYGRGVSNVKIKTVYYQTTPPSSQSCNFDITIEMVGPDTNPRLHYPHLLACAKYKPPPNEDFTESGLTVMKIQLPTGVEGYLEDLKQFRDTMPPLISHFEQKGTTVIIQMDSVPSDNFLCVGFRTRTGFRVGGVSESLFSVFEPQDKGSMCTKQFSSQEQKLQRLCVGDQCQCMTAACAAYRGKLDLTLTVDKRTEETCKPNIKYAYKVNVKSITAEGDFTTFTATVVEVLKNTDKAFDTVTSGTEVELVKKITCSSVDVQQNKQYLVMGSRGSEVTLGRSVKYRFPLDSEAVVELLPTDCSSPDCLNHISLLDEFALELQLSGCPDAS